MFVKFPVRLENELVITGNEEPFEFDEGQRFNGFDADNNRITNIVGFDGVYLLKQCPNCNNVYVSLDFGPEGRSDGDHDRRRDQSWCIICRRNRKS
ncbi:hypothetical protein Psfp_02364 [Pelotomaculum sp. FP]|uniref:hypothetical protein n=1 Tax=Pelotomaculum sp. FP TaxID=261474 RepID=UPI001064882C|nr:hypothetical protein [Pelotomaculum sp. FP]TEB15188.1 hypothetical protein Psfp_02364 [Pelotomaculum sp. FP]